MLPHVLNRIAALGGVLLLYGLGWLVPSAALKGLAVALLAKLWYLGRLRWLVADMAGDARLATWRGAATEPGARIPRA